MNRIVKILLALSAVVGGILTASQPVHAITHYVQLSTPTIFVHGWGSSSHAEEKMANAARNAGVTRTIVKANVDKQGAGKL